jgi:dTDP-L-rhamnose 4-epimerase
VGERVLVTGGAGFIGSHLVDLLVAEGYEVRVLDCFHPAAHTRRPGYLNPAAELIEGDLTDPAVAAAAVEGIDAVSHQAAMVGLGLDFADVADYVVANDLGTARLLAALARNDYSGPLVLASSMVVYGEGRYLCRTHGDVRPAPRDPADLEAGRFEPSCPRCGLPLDSASIDEDAPTEPRSVYAATKLHQEHLCRLFARENPEVSVTMLRYHNVYGPRMPRDTPYAGVASIFRSALAGGRSPHVFEDGGQLRDFIHVADIARANRAALGRRGAPVAYNVATGAPRSILDVAELLSEAAGPDAPRPEVTGEYRLGDVRHVFADPGRAAVELGFEAHVDLARGMAEFATADLR